MNRRTSYCCRVALIVLPAVLSLVVAGTASARSTAHETPVPSHIFDCVPADPPVPPPPKPKPEPAVTTIRRLPGPTEATQTLVAPKAAPETWYDGDTVTIGWDPPEGATTVRFYYHGERCRLGGRSRGKFDGVINGGMMPNTGETTWKVPWLDGPYLHLRMAAYDDDEECVAVTYRTVRLLPRELKKVPLDCLAISRRVQRLYYIRGGEIKRMHMVSTAARGYTTPKMRPGARSRRRGAMGKVFSKSYNPYSSLYHVHMRYWLGITSSGSHGIHATSPNLYYRLGRPASHGCVRQHRSDAKVLYSMVNVGTAVYVF